ncbi:MAG: hypothetical protein FJ304_22180 [Planctomycetes bacterium]|nr:hypothetical protein [Planctomycetota bacterium]
MGEAVRGGPDALGKVENAVYGGLTKGTNMVLDVMAKLLNLNGLKGPVRDSITGFESLLDTTIDLALANIVNKFAPPILAGKKRWNILGAAKEFKWRRADGVVDTHHVWFEGTMYC